MTQDEFLSAIKKHNPLFAPGVSQGQITLTNTALQNIRAAMLPVVMMNLYTAVGGINIGGGYIYGIDEIKRGNMYPIPSIMDINQDLASIAALRGKTIFGRNDLFWFAFDSFGTFYMLDNVTLRTLRKYDDAYRAMYDCLMGGRI